MNVRGDNSSLPSKRLAEPVRRKIPRVGISNQPPATEKQEHKTQLQTVFKKELAMESQKLRIRAEQIRQRLKSRHNSPGFIDILNNLSDAELVAKADEHHREAIEFELARKAKEP